jgi:hypothetical protein
MLQNKHALYSSHEPSSSQTLLVPSYSIEPSFMQPPSPSSIWPSSSFSKEIPSLLLLLLQPALIPRPAGLHCLPSHPHIS